MGCRRGDGGGDSGGVGVGVVGLRREEYGVDYGCGEEDGCGLYEGGDELTTDALMRTETRSGTGTWLMSRMTDAVGCLMEDDRRVGMSNGDGAVHCTSIAKYPLSASFYREW